MLTRVRLTNARTVRGWPTLKNNTECFRNGLVNSAALSQFKQCVTLLLILVDTECKELYLPLLVTRIHCTMWWVWKHICQYQWSWDKPYSPGCNHLCPMLQFGSKHVCIEDVHIFKHCREMTLFLLWIGTYCISCVVQQTSGVKDLSSLVRYDDSSLAVSYP